MVVQGDYSGFTRILTFYYIIKDNDTNDKDTNTQYNNNDDDHNKDDIDNNVHNKGKNNKDSHNFFLFFILFYGIFLVLVRVLVFREVY